jgi:dTDP-glucose 4,6-dehydratase
VRWDHADVELRVPSVTKARELLHWEPRFDLEEGLSETIAWYRRKLESER